VGRGTPKERNKEQDIEKTEESEFIICALQHTLSGRSNQGDEMRLGTQGTCCKK